MANNFLKRDDYKEILLKTTLASFVVYQDDPKKYLEETPELKSYDHKIENISFSYSHGNQIEYFNKLHKVKYLMINDEQKKIVYVAFRGTENIDDILDDVKIYPVIGNYGRFHNGIYKRAETVPCLHFFEKLIEGYNLVFTGHSLGAATGAMITIKLLESIDMTEKYAKNITFIGYGCPSIADIYFKDKIEARHKDRFFFIKNQEDIVVEILDYVSYLIYEKK